jgi:hypothetical protein
VSVPTDPVKFVGWHTAAKQLDKAGVPRDFHTESKVCIIANVWKELNKYIAAVEDRGLLVDFRPGSHDLFLTVYSSIFLQNRGLRNHRGGVAPGAVSLPGADGSTC